HHTAGSAPQVEVYETRLHELAGVVGQIERLLAEGCPPEEIAVIYARHRQANRLMALLGKKNIPFQTRRPENALDHPIVEQLRELLRYLAEESRQPYSGEHRLFRLLHAAFFGIHPADLAQLAATARQTDSKNKPGRYEAAARQHQQRPGFWRLALTDPEFLQRQNLKTPAAFEPVSQQLDAWIAAAHNLPLPRLLERLLHQSGLLQWALRQPRKAELLQALYSFYDFAESETERNPRLYGPEAGAEKSGLERLLLVLDSMDDNRLALPLQTPLRSDAGIQLLTAHSAKGLEFRCVFMIDCVEELWEKNTGGNRGRFALPPRLALSGEEDALEARRRLFYVAMTRAKEQLRLSYAQTGEGGKALQASRFVEETGLKPEMRSPTPEALLDTQALLLSAADDQAVALPEPEMFEAMMRQFSLSVTAFNRYLRCPLAFYYEDFLNIPGAMSEAAAFGIALHSALQQFFLKMKTDKAQHFPAPEVLQRLFSAEMERQRGFFSENNFKQRLAIGRETLRRLHTEQVPHWRKRAVVERRIDRAELDGIPLTGVLDKIEWLDDHSLRIVDYKTGLPDPRKAAPPDERQALGGDYWRQMAFYTILLRESRIYPESVSSAQICWLEPDKRDELLQQELRFSLDELAQVETLIRDTWEQIRAARFSPGCGQPNCAWCNMHRWNAVADSGMEREEDELDD
ncbi:MAG: ATP-dependent helicase, partial [Saprospiraceae bacterium]|nr:ATP-dependent helicase [Saprospiraceae bacterium]